MVYYAMLSEKEPSAMQNYVDCEAHNELLSMGLKSISF